MQSANSLLPNQCLQEESKSQSKSADLISDTESVGEAEAMEMVSKAGETDDVSMKSDGNAEENLA